MPEREFPPRVSTAVEGSAGSDFSLQKALYLQCFGRLVCSPLRVHEWRGWATGVEHQIELTAESLWSEVAGRLRGALNDTTYGTWFGEAQGLELGEDRFVLGVPNDFTRDWIEGHFLGLIGAAIRDVTGRERPIELRVSRTRVLAEPRDSRERRRGARRRRSSSGSSRAGPKAAASTRSTPSTRS